MRLRWQFLALLVGALVFRLFVVRDWHAPAGDGWQYFRLAEQLRLSGRYAYEPPPAPLAWSRLPGYSLFIAGSAIGHSGKIEIGEHTLRMARWNSIFDITIALLLFALLRKEVSRLAGVIIFVAIVLCPILLTCSTFALTESFATFLGVVVVYLVLGSRGRIAWLVGAGVVLGFDQLTRVDSFTLVPALVLALFWGTPWRRALLGGLVLGVVAMAVWLPWPLRNLRTFGAPHAEGTEWLSQDGAPQPPGVMVWMRSWATGRPGEGYDLLAIANAQQLDIKRPGIVLPQMYDDEDEKHTVENIFLQYDKEHLSPAVDARFVALGKKRAHEQPLRQWIALPLKRLVSLWTPIPPYELPVRVRWLGLPYAQRGYGFVELVAFLLSLVGLAIYWRRYPRLLSVCALVIVGRSLLHSTIAHPCPTERYLVECTPFVLIAGAIALAALIERLRKA